MTSPSPLRSRVGIVKASATRRVTRPSIGEVVTCVLAFGSGWRENKPGSTGRKDGSCAEQTFSEEVIDYSVVFLRTASSFEPYSKHIRSAVSCQCNTKEVSSVPG